MVGQIAYAPCWLGCPFARSDDYWKSRTSNEEAIHLIRSGAGIYVGYSRGCAIDQGFQAGMLDPEAVVTGVDRSSQVVVNGKSVNSRPWLGIVGAVLYRAGKLWA